MYILSLVPLAIHAGLGARPWESDGELNGTSLERALESSETSTGDPDRVVEAVMEEILQVHWEVTHRQTVAQEGSRCRNKTVWGIRVVERLG